MEAKSQPTAAKPTSELRIEDLRSDAAQLSADEFEDRYGNAFLLVSTTGFKQSKNATSTEVLLLDLEDDVGERTAGVSVRILPIRASKNSLTHLVTVGRTSKNDVTISDISVSRFHAFFKRNPAGGFQIHDSGSTNGTTVNGASVCTREAGPPTNVASGDNIRFGQVDVTFLEVDALRSYVAKFGE
jgi:pSer/pThr/pTyr-binding forkhead associated (FHA) protein